jgi:hypothetical protein
VVRDINKYSNNIMAQHVLLTLGMQRTGVASFDSARQSLAQWWAARWGNAEQPVVDNGAGLSRNASITASGLGQMLQNAWVSPVMPEFVSSMPIVGVDGTLRRSKSRLRARPTSRPAACATRPRWPAMSTVPAASAMCWWPWPTMPMRPRAHGLGCTGGLDGGPVAARRPLHCRSIAALCQPRQTGPWSGFFVA